MTPARRDNSYRLLMSQNALPLDIVIMAAGKGTRMKSKTPKVLQKLAGRALLQHVLDTAAQLQARSAVVITGHGAQEVEAAVAQGRSADVLDLKFVRQEPSWVQAMPCSRPCLCWQMTAWWWCSLVMCR